MPHKHKRKHDGDEKNYDLPPQKQAKPLKSFDKPERKHHKGAKPKPQPQKQKRDTAKEYKGDDTPREFARLMQRQAGQKLRNGLDDGNERKAKGKKQKDVGEKRDDSAGGGANATIVSTEDGTQLKILPGERMADFAARVNQALPLAGLARKSKDVGGPKEQRTKTEKRLHRMYAEWREQEAKRKEKEEEFLEDQEEKEEELQTELGGQNIHLPSTGKRTKSKRMLTEAGDDEDPWQVLKSKRDAPKGLHDVVQAPPEMKVVPKEKFKVRNNARVDVANVPGAAGSLKRREALGEARKEVIERYRSMMKGRSGL